MASALAQVEMVNLGFGGGALLDPFIARTIRDTRADLVSLKIGINIVDADLMRLHAFSPAVHGSSTPSAKGTPPPLCWPPPHLLPHPREHRYLWHDY